MLFRTVTHWCVGIASAFLLGGWLEFQTPADPGVAHSRTLLGQGQTASAGWGVPTERALENMPWVSDQAYQNNRESELEEALRLNPKFRQRWQRYQNEFAVRQGTGESIQRNGQILDAD